MKFLIILSFLALAVADEDKTQEKKTQPFDSTQNISTQSAPTSLLNSQVFPPTSFSNVFGTSEPVSNLAYAGFNGNVSPIHSVNPDFFVAPTTGVANGAVPIFPVTRTVLPGATPVVQGLQTAFPVAGNVFPAGVTAIPAQFPAVGAGIIPTVSGISNAALDAGTAAANGVVSPVVYRFLTPESITGISTQGLQTAQQVGLAAIPAFTSGILPSLTNGVLQTQTIPGIQQVLKGPTGNPTGTPNIPGLNPVNISSGPLNNAFRHA